MKLKTLQHLKEYFSTTDNTYIQNQLKLLELEIEELVIKTRIEECDKAIDKLKTI